MKNKDKKTEAEKVSKDGVKSKLQKIELKNKAKEFTSKTKDKIGELKNKIKSIEAKKKEKNAKKAEEGALAPEGTAEKVSEKKAKPVKEKKKISIKEVLKNVELNGQKKSIGAKIALILGVVSLVFILVSVLNLGFTSKIKDNNEVSSKFLALESKLGTVSSEFESVQSYTSQAAQSQSSTSAKTANSKFSTSLLRLSSDMQKLKTELTEYGNKELTAAAEAYITSLNDFFTVANKLFEVLEAEDRSADEAAIKAVNVAISNTNDAKRELSEVLSSLETKNSSSL
nr:hypothetical protein [Lachnospiraceae bacterium]